MWKKLKMQSNWGDRWYSPEGTQDKLKIPKNHTLEVKWPDGTVSTEKINYEEYHGSYSDHGHDCNFSGVLPAIRKEIQGKIVLIPLDGYEVWCD